MSWGTNEWGTVEWGSSGEEPGPQTCDVRTRTVLRTPMTRFMAAKGVAQNQLGIAGRFAVRMCPPPVVPPVVTGGPPFTERLAAEEIVNQDKTLDDRLDHVPVHSSILLFLNGVAQEEGEQRDYQLDASNGAITWLAGSGTAVDLRATDELNAFYWTDQ